MRTVGLGLLLGGCTVDATLTPDQPDPFEDLDPDPHVFEARLTAREAAVDLGPEVVHMLTYGARVPGPEIRVRQGDEVVLHLDNELPADFPTTIHWHGIEGTNAADGTPTTQLAVEPGESFTYRFRAPRPGIYWYHPHVRGAQAVHSGLYGALVVEDPDEDALVDLGVLPAEHRVLVLSDVTTRGQEVVSVETDDDFELMNGTEGRLLLVDGRVMPTIDVPARGAVRLQVLNTSIARYWVLSVPAHVLYRVGGQNGLLDRARIEGGSVTADLVDEATGEVVGTEPVALGYDRGRILLAPGERADLVLLTDGDPGDELALRWSDYARGRHGMWMQGDEMVMGDAKNDGQRPDVNIAMLRLVEGGAPFVISEGAPVLEALGRHVAPIDVSGAAIDFTGEAATELGENMAMVQQSDGGWIHEADFFVDGQSWHPHTFGADQELAPTARFARVGDRVVWEVRNTTTMAHPFHLHGFSYQPIGFVRHPGGDEHGERAVGPEARWDLDHVELADTTNIPAHTSLLLHTEIADPNGDGGAVGRWMTHCHLLQHGEAGMMSELVIEP